METFSALLAICAGNSPVPGEFPTQRTVTRNSDVHFDLRPNKRLSKHSWGWWFETSSRPLWRHHNVGPIFVKDNLWTVLIWLLQRPWVWYMYLTVLDRVIPCMFTNVDSFHDESMGLNSFFRELIFVKGAWSVCVKAVIDLKQNYEHPNELQGSAYFAYCALCFCFQNQNIQGNQGQLSPGHQYPDSKVPGANMGPIWGRQDPGGPHVDHRNVAIWVAMVSTTRNKRVLVFHMGRFNDLCHGRPEKWMQICSCSLN